MLKQLTFIIAALLISGITQAQVSKKTHSVGNFTSIDIGSAFEIQLTQGNSNSVVVEADDAIMDKIDVSVKGSTLIIKTTGRINNPKKMAVYVTFKDIESMDFSGASKVSATTPIRGNTIKMNLSGASKLDLDITAKSLRIDTSGASRMTLKGSTEELSMDLSGASRLDGFAFTTTNAKLSASGASRIEITVKNQLSVNASGASNIQYKGGASITSISSSGASNIRKVD